jgi:hypothetical protein
MRASRGQAALELVVVVPLALALALAVATAVAAAGAGVAAEHALDRGIVAAAGGADPVAAARTALPRGLLRRSRVVLRAGALVVRVDPAGPLPAIEARGVLP